MFQITPRFINEAEPVFSSRTQAFYQFSIASIVILLKGLCLHAIAPVKHEINRSALKILRNIINAYDDASLLPMIGYLQFHLRRNGCRCRAFCRFSTNRQGRRKSP